MGEPKRERQKMTDDRRTKIVHDVDEPLPVDPSIYYVYLDIVTGEIGDRKDLAILALNRREVKRFKAMTHPDRVTWAKGRRYFGDVPEASIYDV